MVETTAVALDAEPAEKAPEAEPAEDESPIAPMEDEMIEKAPKGDDLGSKLESDYRDAGGKIQRWQGRKVHPR